MRRFAVVMALLCVLTVSASAAYIPDEVVSENRDGRQLIIKTFTLSPGDDPGQLVEDPFELEGYSYHHLETVKQENPFRDSRMQTETVTVETDTDDLSAILGQLAPSLEYSKDGYSGTLTLDHTTLQTEAAGYLGRLKELMDGKRKNGYAYGRGEKYSLELGGDINHAIASEFAMLAAPETLPLFLRKLQRKALKQYQRREPIQKGSGDIICMLDESASAEGQAPWCKAVALALMDIAIRDKRRFAVIHFAGVGHFQTDLFLPGQYTREDVLRCAETFLNGNTDYETPLREALRLMTREGFENADMVFVTDGACRLPDSFAEEFRKEQAARGFQVTGILLDAGSSGFDFSLQSFCGEVYRTSQLSRDQIARQLVGNRIA